MTQCRSGVQSFFFSRKLFENEFNRKIHYYGKRFFEVIIWFIMLELQLELKLYLITFYKSEIWLLSKKT